jgi:hypothetical protein
MPRRMQVRTLSHRVSGSEQIQHLSGVGVFYSLLVVELQCQVGCWAGTLAVVVESRAQRLPRDGIR